jgi:hypothetical protein
VENKYLKSIYYVYSTRRFFISALSSDDSPESSFHRCDLDSHADTSLVGRGFILLGEPYSYVNVHGFAKKFVTNNVPIGTAATVWISPLNGKPYLFVVHECIFMGDQMPHTLLCPNQLRANGLIVEDTPKQYDSRSSHSIIDKVHKITIPLYLYDVFSYFETRKPTDSELENLERIELTSPNDWRSQRTTMVENEPTAFTAAVDTTDIPTDTYLSHVLPDHLEFHSDESLYDRYISSMYTCNHLDITQPSGVNISAVTTSAPKPFVTPKDLASRWHITIEQADKTLKCTTQHAVRNIYAPSERKVRLKAPWLNFPSLRSDIYVDSMFSLVPALHGYTGGSVYTNGDGYDRFYPWTRKAEHPDTLMQFINDVGVPQTLISDNAPEEIYGRARETCRKYRIQQKTIVPYSPWQNDAEACIRELKRKLRRTLRRTGASPRLWAYCLSWCTAVRRLTASALPRMKGRTPEEIMTGSTPDISSMIMFDWYQPVYYWTPTVEFPNERKLIGRWLGIAESCVDEMAYYVLTHKGNVVTRKSVWGLTADELRDPVIGKNIASFDISVRILLEPKPVKTDDLPPNDVLHPGDDETLQVTVDDNGHPEFHSVTPEELDEYIHTQLILPRGGDMVSARVLKRARDGDNVPIGRRHDNPILDTRQYEVEFPDGSLDIYTANVIAENLHQMADPHGRDHTLFKGIIGHRQTNNTSKGNGMSTAGWDMCVQWTDGTSTWLPLKDLKQSNPIQTAEYAKLNGLAKKPGFSWWVEPTLGRRNHIISKVKTRYWKRTHKFGIAMPKSVKDALALDAESGTSSWREAIAKEMKNVMPAFRFRDDDIVPPGYTKIDCHMVFDIKVDLTRKARLVAGGHQTEVPKDSVYSSVVSRDSVRIAFMLAALNGLDVLAADIQNAYLNAPTKEKCYTIAGPEFGADKVGRPVLIVRALYGLRSSGARWRDHLADTIRSLGFKGCLADADVWMRPNTKPNGLQYWEYVLVYVDDLLVISHDVRTIMDKLGEHYTLKPGSVREPKDYLGSDIKKFTQASSNGDFTECWSMSSDTYVKRAVAEVSRTLEEVGQRLRTKIHTPLATGYRAEMDGTPELDARRANYYQGLIGTLRWICELGRVDILVSVSMLSRFLANPREGHLEQAIRIFAYLKEHDRSRLVFSPENTDVRDDIFTQHDWSSFYPDVKEAIPPNVPEPRGNPVTITCYVDADHAGCRVTRRSQTGILLFIQQALIAWYSKRQNTVETSTFGSEFIALRTAIEQIEALRYKLRMMGVPIDGPTSVMCDNESVFKNAAFPESVLQKKHNSISYHKVREAQAANTVRVGWIPSEQNLADVLTKSLPSVTLHRLCSQFLH